MSQTPIAYKKTFGQPEPFVPTRYKRPSRIPVEDGVAFPAGEISFRTSSRGCQLEFALDSDEEIFGFGLQLKGFRHKGHKKHLRSNADPIADSGDSHAPVPFFVSTKGYGVYIDTARYATVYCGYHKNAGRKTAGSSQVKTSTQELYAVRESDERSTLIIDIPTARGVDLYWFTGGSITDVVSAYNQFSGGGCLPPLWGMGVLYRCFTRFNSQQALNAARYIRKSQVPCSVFGLEPGWQTHSYSCSYVWDKDRFGDHEQMLQELRDMHYEVNLWEHAFVHPSSPLHSQLADKSGDYEVWQGLVPDFSLPQARKAFADYHREELIEKGISGFKLDECDGSDYTGGWTFPDCSVFPSGLDGEQMHTLFGVLYQQCLLDAFGDRRTLSYVRNSGACASPYPFALYSDLYDHKDFIRGVCNAGFSGLLWVPEIRTTKTKEDFIRRLQTVVFSPQALIDAWFSEEVPWIPNDAEEEVRELCKLRMSLVPYIYQAFYHYYQTGVAPIRALVSDYTDDKETYGIDDAYLFGPSMLVAPMVEGEHSRKVYLPGGEWYDFWTGERFAAGWHEITTEQIPVFVKSGTLLPLAEPLQYLDENTIFQLSLRCYGEKGEAYLLEDDGKTYSGTFAQTHLCFSGDQYSVQQPEKSRYQICDVTYIR
ncbi:MAG TPA: glycoside hydrolase [Candidatus Gallacutalibacter stercoravium]|nr:glycoside hydrolase [Candidatus Gallacutalibacter stercoravium]